MNHIRNPKDIGYMIEILEFTLREGRRKSGYWKKSEKIDLNDPESM